MGQIRALIVDDSAFMRKMVGDILSRSDKIEVVGTARNGQEALDKLEALAPHVITLDVEMPVMDGIETLRRVMEVRPTPIVMLSSLTEEGAEVTLRALHMGAVDFIHKPSGAISLDIEKVAEAIIATVEAAAGSNMSSLARRPLAGPKPVSPPPPAAPAAPRPSPRPDGTGHRAVVVIGTSTGGPRALQEVIPRLPADLEAPVVVVQHMPPKFTKSLAERLDMLSAVEVREARDGDPIRPGTVLLAPGGRHMRVGDGHKIALSDEPPLWGVRPAADLLIESVAQSYGAGAVGVIMTGMGHDGARAMQYLKEHGGSTIAESEETCVIYGMPRAVVEAGAADEVVPLQRIAERIVRLVRERAAKVR